MKRGHACEHAGKSRNSSGMPDQAGGVMGILSAPSKGTARQQKSTRGCHRVLSIPTGSGRRDWTRTNDPHHVKVVL